MPRHLHVLDAPDDPPPGLSPLVPGRAGQTRFSLDALRERIERQFHDETGHRPDILVELSDADARRTLLREVVDYVLAVEGVRLLPGDKVALLDETYRSLFTFGPLDDLLADETVTEIEIDGPKRLHVRRGAGRLEPVGAAFEDRAHLDAVLGRLLEAGGGARREDVPFLEFGAVLGGRMARVTVAGPPVSVELNVTIRLHPREPFTLATLAAQSMVPARAVDLLRAILAGGHGLLIVGDVGTGKTTLAGALAAELPEGAQIVAVERAAEIALPPSIERHTHTPGDLVAFGDLIRTTVDEAPDWLLIDEVRSEDSAAAWDTLTREPAPHCVWAFRGDPSPDRLRSALTMLIRRNQPGVDQGAIHRALAERLPFIAGLRVIDGAARLALIAEWTLESGENGDLMDLRPLMQWRDGALRVEGPPARSLDLPGEFWT